MAIIKSTLRRLRHYPFIAIEPNAADKLLCAAKKIPFGGDDPQLIVHLLECYCDVIGNKLTSDMLTREGMPHIHDGFCGAIISGKLVDLSDGRKRRFCRALGAILLKLGIRFPSIQGDTWLPFPFTQSLMQWKEERIQFEPERLAYWDGWMVENKRDRAQYVHLAKLYQTHGKEFVDEFHSGIQRHLESRADVVNNGYDRIVNFLVAKPDEWPASTFKHPIKIYNFFKALIRATFKDKKPRARSTIDLGYRWDRHIGA